MDDERECLILYTYKPVWKYEKTIHSIGDVKLWFAVPVNDAIYFVVSVCISALLIKFLPFYNRVNWVIKFGVVPFGIMKFLTKQKLDGKMPHKFFIDYVRYKTEPKKYCRFNAVSNETKYKFSTPVIYRYEEVINKTEEVLRKNKKQVKLRV